MMVGGRESTMQSWRAAIVRLTQRPAVMLTVLAALLALQIRPWWLPVPDGCGYLSIARSIAHGGPVTNLGSAKLHFAPGYPLLASLAYLVDDHPFLWLSILQWLLAVVFMLGVYRWSRRAVPGAELWITALTMVNASLWMHVRLTISETAFMAALVWTIDALDHLAAAQSRRAVWRWAAAAAVMTIVVTMTRQVGILVAAGYGLAMLVSAVRRRTSWPRAIGTTLAVGLPATLAVLAVMVYETRMAHAAGLSHRTYLDYFHETGVSWAAQVLEGLRLRISEAGRLLIPGMYKTYAESGVWLDLNVAVYALLFAGLSWSWWRIVRRASNVFALTMPFYLGLYIVYPFDQGTRYLLPALPVLVLCLWYLLERIPQPHRGRTCVVLVLLHLGVAVGSSVRATRPLEAVNRQWPAIETLVAMIDDDARTVQVWNAPPFAGEMVQLAGDRRVEYQDQTAIDPAAGWLITSVASPEYPGFVEHARAGSMKLLERAPQLSQAGQPPTMPGGQVPGEQTLVH